MNSLKNYLTRENLCRQHADLDKTTASSWSEEAEIWAKLALVEKRLLVLKSEKNGPSKRRNSRSPPNSAGPRVRTRSAIIRIK